MKFIPIFKEFTKPKQYQCVDLSKSHLSSLEINSLDNTALSNHLEEVKAQKQAKVLYGGYMETRSLYNDKSHFKSGNKQRNIHLGVDFWAAEGTEVVAPYDGVVHSFANNNSYGNYGPTIILRHNIDSNAIFSLYGHLSLDSIEDIHVGLLIPKGKVFARLGDESVNVGYVPHLHFQLLKDIEDYNGDYPGVCHQDELDFYTANTIDPNIYFKF